MYPGASLWLLLTLLATTQAANNPEVSWGDWIIVDETEPGTSILLRRITPKSVFVAPTFNGCSEGYRQDSMGRCVKLVKVNQQAQWNFFLERLNSMYAPSSTSKNPQKEAGPFHISLPIGSENSQEDVIVKKRVPPKFRDENVKSTTPTTTTSAQSTTTTTSTTLPPPTTTTTIMQESLIPEVFQSTTVEVSTTEREFNSQTDSTTEVRRDTTTERSFDAVMLGDQPVVTEDYIEAGSHETPKIHKEDPSQLPEKPFVIIVTNKPTTRAEETTSFMPLITEEEGEDVTSESPSTTEVTTEGTTETTFRYTTEINPKTTTDYDESLSETSIRPTVKYNIPSTVRPRCDSRILHVRDDYSGSSDCEPAEVEIVSNEREITNPSALLPANLPNLETNSRVRFPSESYVPERKTQSYVRFPEATSPQKDRPGFWWPSWQIQDHPGIRGWPPSDDQSSDQVIHRQYPPYSLPGHSWSDTNVWRRRFFQRD